MDGHLEQNDFGFTPAIIAVPVCVCTSRGGGPGAYKGRHSNAMTARAAFVEKVTIARGEKLRMPPHMHTSSMVFVSSNAVSLCWTRWPSSTMITLLMDGKSAAFCTSPHLSYF